MSNSYFTLKKLGGSKFKNPKSSLQKMTNLLKSTSEPGRFQFQILKGEKASVFHIEVEGKSSKLYDEKTDRPTFEIITSEETWLEIAGGKLSPLKAFVQNKMRVRGNVEAGQRFLLQFAGPGKTSK